MGLWTNLSENPHYQGDNYFKKYACNDLANLKPAKLAGMLSEGMILCAEDAEGNLALMKPEKDMPAGAEIC